MRSHFVGELESVRQNMLSMGELTLESISHSLKCLTRTEGVTYEQVTELESRIDDWNRLTSVITSKPAIRYHFKTGQRK
jgi:phosphate uptake regulator